MHNYFLALLALLAWAIALLQCELLCYQLPWPALSQPSVVWGPQKIDSQLRLLSEFDIPVSMQNSCWGIVNIEKNYYSFFSREGHFYLRTVSTWMNHHFAKLTDWKRKIYVLTCKSVSPSHFQQWNFSQFTPQEFPLWAVINVVWRMGQGHFHVNTEKFWWTWPFWSIYLLIQVVNQRL